MTIKQTISIFLESIITWIVIFEVTAGIMVLVCRVPAELGYFAIAAFGGFWLGLAIAFLAIMGASNRKVS